MGQVANLWPLDQNKWPSFKKNPLAIFSLLPGILISLRLQVAHAFPNCPMDF